jgi:hypothetical protein
LSQERENVSNLNTIDIRINSGMGSAKVLDCESARELIPALLLDALEVDEAVAVLEHVRMCQACRTEADTLRPVVGVIGLTAPDAGAPPLKVKHRLMTMVGETLRSQPTSRTRRPIFRPIATLVPAAIAIALLIGVGAWAVSLQSQLGQQQTRLDRLTQQQAAVRQFILAPNIKPVAVKFEGSTSASATLYASSSQIAMAVQGLEPLKAGEVYQCWWHDAQGHAEPGSVFFVDSSGSGVWVWDRPTEGGYDLMTVAKEPRSGLTRSEGPVILTVSLTD